MVTEALTISLVQGCSTMTFPAKGIDPSPVQPAGVGSIIYGLGSYVPWGFSSLQFRDNKAAVAVKKQVVDVVVVTGLKARPETN